jgi:hypothetical protein
LELLMLHCSAGACESTVSALVRALRIDPVYWRELPSKTDDLFIGSGNQIRSNRTLQALFGIFA